MILNFGKKVQQARIELSLTQKQLAAALNKSTQSIKLVEKGSSLMKLETFIKLCEVTGKSPDFFLQDNCKQAKIENILSLIDDINRVDDSQLIMLGNALNIINKSDSRKNRNKV